MAAHRARRQPFVLVYRPSSIVLRFLESGHGLGKSWKVEENEERVIPHIHLPDRSAAADAADLIDRFGIFAATEAAARAGESRERGNVIHFCRWRQIERMILLLSGAPDQHTRH